MFATPITSFCQCVVIAYSREQLKSSPICLQFVAKGLTNILEGLWSEKVVSLSGSDTTATEKVEVGNRSQQQPHIQQHQSQHMLMQVRRGEDTNIEMRYFQTC